MECFGFLFVTNSGKTSHSRPFILKILSTSWVSFLDKVSSRTNRMLSFTFNSCFSLKSFYFFLRIQNFLTPNLKLFSVQFGLFYFEWYLFIFHMAQTIFHRPEKLSNQLGHNMAGSHQQRKVLECFCWVPDCLKTFWRSSVTNKGFMEDD